LKFLLAFDKSSVGLLPQAKLLRLSLSALCLTVVGWLAARRNRSARSYN
jgi:hypothetical protein